MTDLTDDWESMEEFLPSDDKLKESVQKALAILFSASQVDGAHHKTWVLDQAVRELTGDKYERFINAYCFEGIENLDDPDVVAMWEAISQGNYDSGDYSNAIIEKVENGLYSWETGIAP